MSDLADRTVRRLRLAESIVSGGRTDPMAMDLLLLVDLLHERVADLERQIKELETKFRNANTGW